MRYDLHKTLPHTLEFSDWRFYREPMSNSGWYFLSKTRTPTLLQVCRGSRGLAVKIQIIQSNQVNPVYIDLKDDIVFLWNHYHNSFNHLSFLDAFFNDGQFSQIQHLAILYHP